MNLNIKNIKVPSNLVRNISKRAGKHFSIICLTILYILQYSYKFKVQNVFNTRLLTRCSGGEPGAAEGQWYSHPSRSRLREQREVPRRDGDVHEQRGALHHAPLRLRGGHGQGRPGLPHVGNIL